MSRGMECSTGTIDRSTATGAPAALASYRQRVDAAIEDLLDRRAGLAPDPCVGRLVEVVREFVAGGKRLRPLFCYCGWLAAGGSAEPPGVVDVGAALELFHSFALIHDDVMDGSDRRRGRPTVHRLLRAGYRQPADDAAADRFGSNLAVLVGDLCLVWSDELLFGAAVDPDRMRTARPLLSAMRTEIMAGQYLDIEQSGELGDLDRAWRVIRYKTASYTTVRPLQIGAALAGADRRLVETLGAYGQPLGAAYQLRDDLLGVFGDPAATGKPDTDDLRDGKRTVLVALTWQRADARQRSTVRELLGRPGLDDDGVERLRGVIRDTGAEAIVAETISRYTARALSVLEAAEVPEPAREALVGLATAATRRDR